MISQGGVVLLPLARSTSSDDPKHGGPDEVVVPEALRVLGHKGQAAQPREILIRCRRAGGDSEDLPIETARQRSVLGSHPAPLVGLPLQESLHRAPAGIAHSAGILWSSLRQHRHEHR